MISIQYGYGFKLDFPRYYEHDAAWYVSAESSTKSFFINTIKKNFNIIDAGAQIGMYAALFSKLAHQGSVYAFEPTDTSSLLHENLEYNNCRNAHIQNIALSNKEGAFFEKIHKIWSQNVVDEKEHNFTTIDKFVEQNNLKIDLIKIDVDSYDVEVLLGSEKTLKEQSPIVVVELNNALKLRGYSPEDAISFMAKIGYQVDQILDGENFVFIKAKS